MTRPKVSPDKRQRTAQACESCKRRKQKCNGLQPCNTCTKRNLTCTYGPAGPSENGSVGVDEDHSSSEHPAKRRFIDSPVDVKPNSPFQSAAGDIPLTLPPRVTGMQALGSAATAIGSTPSHMTNPNAQRAPQNNVAPSTVSNGVSRGGSLLGEGDEEAVVYNSARMLQDPTGRLLYVGDSATLSYLQLIRMIVESTVGPTPFTLDPQRHRILEKTENLPHNVRKTHLLPERQTAQCLIDAFFTHTSGLVRVFSKRSFMATFEACYADPLNVDPSWLCLLHLVFATGLVLAVPTPGSPEQAIINKLRSDPIDRAEMFYRNAKDLNDPASGFEDADFWSVQALVLMTLYTLAVSKRNAAYAFHGMAIRSAFALGLHREETMVIFGDEERATRRNLWRSLFVLDRFLAASLGRPTAISEDDCSGDALNLAESAGSSGAFFNTSGNQGPGVSGLEAAVRSCRHIGVILKKVYSKRKISTKLAQQIADECKTWSKNLDPSLNWRQVPTTFPDPEQGVAILHVNLLYCHTIILLTRPFFLHLLHKVQQEKAMNGHRSQRSGARMEKFSEACVIASCHSIVLVQNAWDGGYLSQRNPFVHYFLFAATLIVLSNEFSKLYETPAAQSCIQSAINITAYWGEIDPLSRRLLFILTAFRDVVNRQQDSGRLMSIPASNHEDPITSLFANNTMSPLSTFGNQRTNISNGPSIQPRSFPGSVLPNSVDPTISAAAPSMGASQQSTPQFQLPMLATTSPTADGGPTSGSTDGSDALGEEIDFAQFWHMPTTGLTPAIGNTPLPTPGGGLDFGPGLIQGISDSVVPLFGMTEFAGA